MNAKNDASALHWRSWPVRDKAGTLFLALPVCAAALAAVYVFTGHWAFVVLGAVILAVGLKEYFLPMRYEIDGDGVRVRHLLWTQSRLWADIRRVAPTDDGVLLSPFPEPSRIERHRGLFLRFAGNRDGVLAALRERAGGANWAVSEPPWRPEGARRELTHERFFSKTPSRSTRNATKPSPTRSASCVCAPRAKSPTTAWRCRAFFFSNRPVRSTLSARRRWRISSRSCAACSRGRTTRAFASSWSGGAVLK
ncbi:MAG: hypothetical protein M5R36_06290 [Deltaproteobacteria bacterium]|nr:hypothetical protein [Deltaproteobacteria bacterium]